MQRNGMKQRIPWQAIRQLASLNLLGTISPTIYGGAALDYVSYALVVEELARVDGSLGISSPRTRRYAFQPHLCRWNRGAKAPFPGPACPRRKTRCLGLDQSNMPGVTPVARRRRPD